MYTKFDTVVEWDDTRAYFFSGASYYRYSLDEDAPEDTYPKSISSSWPGVFTQGIDAAVNMGNGNLYFFKNNQYIRYNIEEDKAAEGYPKSISGNWPGVFTQGIDAAVNMGNGNLYFFKNNQYIRYNIEEDKAAEGYPKSISGNWPGVFTQGIDAIVNTGNGKLYFFKGDQYIRYDIEEDKADEGYPNIIYDNWNSILRGHAIKTEYAPPEALGQPLDHTFVSTSRGLSWGCFGRNFQSEPNAKIVSKSRGHLLWTKYISDTDGQAALTYEVTGVCHQCANRILVTAGVDVSDSNGYASAILMFGKYGPDTNNFIQHVRAAAKRVNLEYPNSLSGSKIESIINRIKHSDDNEFTSLREDFEEILGSRVPDITSAQMTQLRLIHKNLQNNRHSLFLKFNSRVITKEQYRKQMRDSLFSTLENLQRSLGDNRYLAVFGAPPLDSARLIFMES